MVEASISASLGTSDHKLGVFSKIGKMSLTICLLLFLSYLSYEVEKESSNSVALASASDE